MTPLLAGCADDAPMPRAPFAAAPRAAHAPRPAPPRPSLAASLPAAPTPDPLEAPDGLLGNMDADTAPTTPIPLTGMLTPSPASPADDADALANTPNTLAGSAPGQKMPTQHSHWLRGPIFDARVAVRINGLFLGVYSAPQDRDITMKMRDGINTVTLAYTPLTPTASAHLDILESEHDPPIPPLATFRSPLSPVSSSAELQTTTQTLTFLAR